MKKTIKKSSILILFAFIILITPKAINASNDIKVLLEGQELIFDVPPQIIEGRTLLPLRVIFEELGLEVGWNADSGVITGMGEEIEITLKIDNVDAMVNGVNKKLDVPPKIINGRTLVPVRFIAENLNMNVEWNQENRTIKINKNNVIKEKDELEKFPNNTDMDKLYGKIDKKNAEIVKKIKDDFKGNNIKLDINNMDKEYSITFYYGEEYIKLVFKGNESKHLYLSSNLNQGAVHHIYDGTSIFHFKESIDNNIKNTVIPNIEQSLIEGTVYQDSLGGDNYFLACSTYGDTTKKTAPFIAISEYREDIGNATINKEEIIKSNYYDNLNSNLGLLYGEIGTIIDLVQSSNQNAEWAEKLLDSLVTAEVFIDRIVYYKPIPKDIEEEHNLITLGLNEYKKMIDILYEDVYFNNSISMTSIYKSTDYLEKGTFYLNKASGLYR